MILGVLDTAFAERIAEAMRSEFGADAAFPIHAFEEVPSTMDTARQLLDERGHGGRWSLVISRAQSKGRGREGRTWVSAKDSGLYATFICDASRWPESAGAPLVVGLAVLRAVRRFGVQAGIKWPNDILVLGEHGEPGKKLGGVLCEMTAKQVLLIGIGVNINATIFPPEVPAAALNEVSEVKTDVPNFCAALCRAFDETIGEYSLRGLANLRAECETNLLLRGQKVRALHQGAEKEFELLGLNADGSLRVRQGDAELPLYANEVHFLRD